MRMPRSRKPESGWGGMDLATRPIQRLTVREVAVGDAVSPLRPLLFDRIDEPGSCQRDAHLVREVDHPVGIADRPAGIGWGHGTVGSECYVHLIPWPPVAKLTEHQHAGNGPPSLRTHGAELVGE